MKVIYNYKENLKLNPKMLNTWSRIFKAERRAHEETREQLRDAIVGTHSSAVKQLAATEAKLARVVEAATELLAADRAIFGESVWNARHADAVNGMELCLAAINAPAKQREGE